MNLESLRIIIKCKKITSTFEIQRKCLLKLININFFVELY